MEREKTSVWFAMQRSPEGRQHHKEKSHDGKAKLTQVEAIKRIHNIGNQSGEWMAAYPCIFCDWEWWHIGSFEKIAVSAGLKVSERGVQRIERPVKNEIGDAVGDLKKKLKQLFPETPTSHWKDHLRQCERCADYFPRGWQICAKGAILYHNSLAFQARQIVKERRRKKNGTRNT